MLTKIKEGLLNINCTDPLGRSALLMAIDNENLEMVELLLENKVREHLSKQPLRKSNKASVKKRLQSALNLKL